MIKPKNNYKITELFIRNMHAACCCRLLELEFQNLDAEIISIKAGYLKINYNPAGNALKIIPEILDKAGMSIISKHEIILLEKIKHTVIELIHYMNNADSIAQKSDYLVGKLRMSYRQISALFRKYEPITLERFIILHKIERIKDLIDNEEYTLSEIAYMMDYNSVQYLSNLFKKEVGVSVSEYKKNPVQYKKSWDNLY